ncbi:DUF2357 domain-containing protein [Amycolatopsis sp. w19]|uniref:DUF2357 domain-containing protein n=1 Tax=Amycolatopsis sp. w19 TaxID=3448134 RepID=UPI003F1B0996
MSQDNDSPDPLIVTSVIEIARVLTKAVTMAEWLETNMFVPNTAKHAELNELDEAVLSGLDVLADVCARPHDRLDRSEQLVRADLARRVPPAGIARLSSRTEDLAGVEHGRIRPLRVLTSRYTEYLDFYENQVVAQLVDRLREYLERRIRDLTVLGAGLTDLDEYDRALRRRQSWRSRNRIAQLVATAIEDTAAASAAIDETRTKLSNAKVRLRAQSTTPVLRQANRRARLPIRLMRTNLFTDNNRYRRVGILWERWAVHSTERAQQAQTEEHSFANAYQNYVAALSMRALSILGYAANEEHPPDLAQPRAIRLHGPTDDLTWTSTQGGAISLADDTAVLTWLVAIGDDLGAPALDAIKSSKVDHLLGLPQPTIVIYPGLRANRAALSAPERRRLHPAGFGSDPLLVPVSPLEIEGEERIARALRWTIQGLRFTRSYPPEIHVTFPKYISSTQWYEKRSVRTLAVLRRPSVAEKEELINILEQQRPGQKNLESVQSGISTVSAIIDSAIRVFGLLETCPICRRANAEFQPRDQDTFLCRCAACRTEWGTRRCHSCGERYPILWPHRAVVDAQDGDNLDLSIGADILTVPCADSTTAAGTHFRCPWCTSCPERTNCTCN